MPIGYVITLIVVGIPTGLALVRFRRFGYVLFAVALPASELSHLGILFLGLSTLVVLSQGDLSGVPGGILLGLAGAILVGLLVLLYRAISARAVIHRVLRDHGHHSSRHRTWWVRPLLFPFPWRPSSVTRTGPIFYGDDPRQRLDVYRPPRCECFRTGAGVLSRRWIFFGE